MRIMSVVSASCLLAALTAFGNVAIAQDDQPAYAPKPNATPIYAAANYHPYCHPYFPNHAYRSAVRFSYVPVAPPPKICHGPTSWYGPWFYSTPYYVYARPPLGCPGYAGFSGCDPNAYRTMVPPPIPEPSASEPSVPPTTPTAAPEQLPSPPMPEQLPTPPKQVAPKAEQIPSPPSVPTPK